MLKRVRGTGSSDGGTAQTREVVAIGMGDLLDQTECAQSRDLSRQRRGAHVHMLGEIGTAQAMHVVLAALQGTQQCLLAAVEKFSPLTFRSSPPTRDWLKR